MNNWKKYKLGEICTQIVSGGTPSTTVKEYYENGSILWLRTTEVNFNRIYDTEIKITESGLNNSSAKYVPENCVIVALYGNSAGRVAINKIPLTTNQACCNLSIDNNVANYNFIFYYLFNRYKHLVQISCGSAQQNLSADLLKKYEIEIPNLEIQTRIATFLSQFDDKIELNRQMNKNLEELAELKFKTLLKDKDKWRKGKLGELLENVIPGDWGKDNAEGNYQLETICIRGTDIPELQYGLIPKAPTRFLRNENYERCGLQEGDVIIEISGGSGMDQSTGRSCYISKELLENIGKPLICSNFCKVLRPKQKEFGLFIYTLLNYWYKKRIFFTFELGTIGIKNLDLKYILNDYEIELPKEDLILNFVNEIKVFFQKIQSNGNQTKTLATYRDSILPKLMSGAIEI